MRAVIICGGAISDYNFISNLIHNDDLIICADSGYDHAVKMNLNVYAVLGDFDSIATPPHDCLSIKFPERKNQTDSEIALDYARNLGISDFLFIAATGSRLDHTLTNILLLKDCLARGENAVILNENNKIFLIDSYAILNETPGTIVSLIPISNCSGVTTSHLEYPLLDASLLVGHGLGVSNVMLDFNAAISIQHGLLLVIIAND